MPLTYDNAFTYDDAITTYDGDRGRTHTEWGLDDFLPDRTVRYLADPELEGFPLLGGGGRLGGADVRA